MRGGTSNGVVFRQQDLPADRSQWDAIFLAVVGSPDANARQLDGMGGGISSLSKVCVVGPPTHPEADIDFTFAQVSVREACVDYHSNCGNMSSAVGPFAVDESLVETSGDEARVVIHNTNTGKLVTATFPLDDGGAAVDGSLEISGVAGSGAPVRLEFRDPGGAGTGKLLPTGNALDVLEVPGVGRVEASLVDAANACVFIEAARAGTTGTESPTELDGRTGFMEMLEAIRCAAGVAMGLGNDADDIHHRSPSNPKIGLVAEPRDTVDLAGRATSSAAGDLTARMISMGNTHRALPLTGALCLGVAANPGKPAHPRRQTERRRTAHSATLRCHRGRGGSRRNRQRLARPPGVGLPHSATAVRGPRAGRRIAVPIDGAVRAGDRVLQ